MPIYVYRCLENDQVLEVLHPMSKTIKTWEELCQVAHYDMGETSPSAPVEKLLTTPAVLVPKSNSDYQNLGLTKLVRRDQGVYENVTAKKCEPKIVTRPN